MDILKERSFALKLMFEKNGIDNCFSNLTKICCRVFVEVGNIERGTTSEDIYFLLSKQSL